MSARTGTRIYTSLSWCVCVCVGPNDLIFCHMNNHMLYSVSLTTELTAKRGACFKLCRCPLEISIYIWIFICVCTNMSFFTLPLPPGLSHLNANTNANGVKMSETKENYKLINFFQLSRLCCSWYCYRQHFKIHHTSQDNGSSGVCVCVCVHTLLSLGVTGNYCQ